MSSTPRSDIQRDHVAKTHMDWVCLTGDANVVSVDFARQLELELNEANNRIKRLDEENLRMLDYIKQLEETGDRAILNSYFPDRLTIWNKAKEANQ